MDFFAFMTVVVVAMATAAVVCWVLRPAKQLALGSTRVLAADDLVAINAVMHRSYDKHTEYWIEHLGILVQHIAVTPMDTDDVTLEIMNPQGYGFDAAQVIGVRYFGASEQHFIEELIVGPNSRWIVPKGAHLDAKCFRCSDEDAFVPLDLGVVSRISPMSLTFDHADEGSVTGTALHYTHDRAELRPVFHLALVMIPATLEVAMGAPRTLVETGAASRSMDEILGYARTGR